MFNTLPYMHLLGDYDRDTHIIACDTDYYEALSKMVSGKITEVRFITYMSDPTVNPDTVLVLGKIGNTWYPVCSYWEDEIILTEDELLGKTLKEVCEYYWTLDVGHGMNNLKEQSNEN